MRTNRFYANNYPCSAWATRDGIMQLVGKSLSVKFNQDRFDKYAGEVQSYQLAFSMNKDLLCKKAKVLSAMTGLEIINHRYSHLYHSGGNHLKVYQDAHAFDGRQAPYSLEYVTPTIGRIRNSAIDERALLIMEACDISCVVCEKQIEDSPQEVFTFETSNGFRSEGCCKDCIGVGSRKTGNSDFVLLEILKKVKTNTNKEK